MEKENHRSKFLVHILRSNIAVRTRRNRDEIMVHTPRPDTIAASTDCTRRTKEGVLTDHPVHRVNILHLPSAGRRVVDTTGPYKGIIRRVKATNTAPHSRVARIRGNAHAT